MDHAKKLDFIHKMSKLALEHVQHFDSGGIAGGLGSGLIDALGIQNNFQGRYAQLTPGTNADQLNTAYQGTQGALGQLQDYTTATQGQGAQGMGTQTALANTLAAQAAGNGPNPAQAALAQSTGQNVQNQAAAAASQRGASGNIGLLQRQSAQQGAQTQQQAAGQAATLQAQQQLAAQAAQQGLAATQVNQQAGAVQNLNQAQQGEQNILQTANSALNNANVAMQSNINNVNASVAAGNQAQAGSAAGGFLSGVSSMLGLARGGSVPRHYAPGGYVAPANLSAQEQGPRSFVGQWVNATPVAPSAPNVPASNVPVEQIPDMAKSGSKDKKPAAQPGAPENAGQGPTQANADSLNSDIPYASPNYASSLMKPMASGGIASLAPLLALANKGGKVKASKGEKAVVPDDDEANDKVPTMLSEGEVVIPRSIMMHPMAPEKAAEFVRQEIAKRGLRKAS